MRLEFEKHTVKTNWYEWLKISMWVVILGVIWGTILIALGLLLTYTITQWGKG